MKILKVTIAASALAANFAFASLVDNGLSGNITSYDWSNLGGIPGQGFGQNCCNIASDNSADAVMTKTGGGHYSASMGLYAFSGGTSTMRLTTTAPIQGLETVVFNYLTNSLPDTVVSLNIGGLSLSPSSQGLSQDQSYESAFGTLTPSNSAFQWDLRGLNIGSASEFFVEFTGEQHLSIVGFQLDQSDVFSPAATTVPVPAGIWLFISGLMGLSCVKARKK